MTGPTVTGDSIADQIRAEIASADPRGTITVSKDTRAELDAAGLDPAGRFARHPCDVTADRLSNHTERYADQLTPNEARAIGTVLGALADIASGRRA